MPPANGNIDLRILISASFQCTFVELVILESFTRVSFGGPDADLHKKALVLRRGMNFLSQNLGLTISGQQVAWTTGFGPKNHVRSTEEIIGRAGVGMQCKLLYATPGVVDHVAANLYRAARCRTGQQSLCTGYAIDLRRLRYSAKWVAPSMIRASVLIAAQVKRGDEQRRSCKQCGDVVTTTQRLLRCCRGVNLGDPLCRTRAARMNRAFNNRKLSICDVSKPRIPSSITKSKGPCLFGCRELSGQSGPGSDPKWHRVTMHTEIDDVPAGSILCGRCHSNVRYRTRKYFSKNKHWMRT